MVGNVILLCFVHRDLIKDVTVTLVPLPPMDRTESNDDKSSKKVSTI